MEESITKLFASSPLLAIVGFAVFALVQIVKMLLDKNKHPDPATQAPVQEEDYITLEKFEKLLDKFQSAIEDRLRLIQAETVQRNDFTSYKEFAKTFYETRDNAMATQLKCSNMFVQYRAIDEVKDMLRELRQELKQLPQKVN